MKLAASETRNAATSPISLHSAKRPSITFCKVPLESARPESK